MNNNFYNPVSEQNHTHVHFLEQLSDQEFWRYAQNLAHTQALSLPNSEEYLECETIQGRYLLPLNSLCEIVPPPPKLTFLPLCPSWMLGITAWRRHILPVVDLAAYFSAHLPYNDDSTALASLPAYLRSNSFLLVLDEGHSLFALQVAIVRSIITLEQGQLTISDSCPSWYPQQLQSIMLATYQESVVINPQLLLSDMIRHMKVTAAYE